MIVLSEHPHQSHLCRITNIKCLAVKNVKRVDFIEGEGMIILLLHAEAKAKHIKSTI